MNLGYGIYLDSCKICIIKIIIVDVTAVGVINSVGLILPPYEAWCSAPTDHTGRCEMWLKEYLHVSVQ